VYNSTESAQSEAREPTLIAMVPEHYGKIEWGYCLYVVLEQTGEILWESDPADLDEIAEVIYDVESLPWNVARDSLKSGIGHASFEAC
jgi:hypothetical protein